MALQYVVGGCRLHSIHGNVLTFNGGSQHAKLPHLIHNVPVKNCRDGRQNQALSQSDGVPDHRNCSTCKSRMAVEPRVPTLQPRHLHFDWPAEFEA